jgi:hypothetical protein
MAVIARFELPESRAGCMVSHATNVTRQGGTNEGPSSATGRTIGLRVDGGCLPIACAPGAPQAGARPRLIGAPSVGQGLDARDQRTGYGERSVASDSPLRVVIAHPFPLPQAGEDMRVIARQNTNSNLRRDRVRRDGSGGSVPNSSAPPPRRSPISSATRKAGRR